MWYNQKGQKLNFDSNGYSQYGYDKDGYTDGSGDLMDYDPQQVATTTAPGTAGIAAATTGSNGNNSGGRSVLDSIFGIANSAANVWTSANQASAAQANAQTAQANANAIYGGQRAGVYPTTGMSTGMKVGIGVAVVGVIVLIVVATRKPAAAAAPAAPAA